MLGHRVHFDSDGDHFTIENVQDVEPIKDRNSVLQNEAQKSDWGRHLACVPSVIIHKWLNEEYARGNTELRFLGPGFDEFFRRKIQEPDNKAWRVDNPSNPFHLGWRAK